MLLDYFAHNVFDLHLQKDILNTFIKNDEIDQSAIVTHQVHKLNVFFTMLWKYIFDTYPTSYQFKQFIEDNAIDITKPIPIQSSILQNFLNNLYIIKTGLILKINIIDLNSFAGECIKKLNDDIYIKDCLVKKLEYRYRCTLVDKNNLLYSFFKLASIEKSAITYANISYPLVNPFTGFTIELSPIYFKETSSVQQNISSIIHNDVYFMLKLMNYPVILNLSHQKHTLVIENIYKAFGKKCVVLSKYNYKESFVYSYSVIDEYIYLLPKISPWCLIICGDDGWKKTYKGLSIQDENNVVIIDNTNSKVDDIPRINRVLKLEQIRNTLTYWKAHTKYSCPSKSIMATNNHLLFIDFIYKYIDKHIKKLHPANSKSFSSNKLILIVDNRENDMTVMSCKCAIINTQGWHCKVLTSTVARQFYERELPEVDFEHHPLLDSPFDIDIYNDILQDIELWKKFRNEGYNNVLVIQDDGILVRDGIDRFCEYSYVGAPWADIPDNEYIKKYICDHMVGNGGFSLRNVNDTIEVLENYGDCKMQTFYNNVNRIPEDVYYVKYMTKMGKRFPTREVASYFSMEQIINPQCLGFHKFWNYHPYSEVNQLFDIFLH